MRVITDVDLPFLDKTRELYHKLLKGNSCVVISDNCDADIVFRTYAKVMKIFIKRGLLVVKNVDTIVEDDLQAEFHEF